MFFGLWLLPLGYLVIKSGHFPKLLGVLLVAACFGYLAELLTPSSPPASATALIRRSALAVALVGAPCLRLPLHMPPTQLDRTLDILDVLGRVHVHASKWSLPRVQRAEERPFHHASSTLGDASTLQPGHGSRTPRANLDDRSPAGGCTRPS
jgi:Domain of unknown function (DUF4386)